MMRPRDVGIAACAAFLIMTSANGQDPISFGRTPAVSPDGKMIAFSYLGDLWTVETIGGIARPVTMHEAHDIGPVFSPDGRMIAFSSNRHGNYDVFVVPAVGGRPRRLTFDSANDVVCDWSPDGKSILFSSTRSTNFPHNVELYAVPVEGGRVRRISANEGKEGVFSPRGDQIAYVRGPGTWYRKGYRGSSNDDIWICDADGKNNRQLTSFNGQDTSPMWSADGQSILYVSEQFGTPANIVRRVLSGKVEQLTFHKDDAVRRASISRNGEWVVYECGANLWIVSTKTGGTRKLAIEVHADDKANTERTATLTQDASEFALSWDEKHVAFVVHGELFMMPIAGGRATRLTETPAFDHGIAWEPHSKSIIFVSDRGGQEDLYLLESDDPDHPDLVNAHKFKSKQLTDTPEAEIGISFAPDGRRVAFLRAGKLWTMKPDGSDQKTVVNEVQVFDYDWSPDSKWIVYARQDGSFASELYIIAADGAAPAQNVTHYATYNGGVTWSMHGDKVGFISQRRHRPSMFVLSLQKPSAPGASLARGPEIDWDDIQLRVRQPAALPAEEGAISMDGFRIAFRSLNNNGDDLWVANSDGGRVARLTTGNLRPQQIQWSRRMPYDVIYFRDGNGSLRKVQADSAGSLATISFQAKMVIRRAEEFSEMFEQSWHALRDNFYDPKFHGTDWDAVRAKYRPLVKHVALKEDLYALISLMMGELNASHLGITGFQSVPEERTAELGLIFDEGYRGMGLRISEILKRGPADKRGILLKPGDIVRSIDRVEISATTNLSHLLSDKVGEQVQLQVSSNPTADPKDPKAWRRVSIQGSAREQVSKLMYERWVEHNVRRVAELSKGKLGYIHIPSMDEDGLDHFVRALYSDNFDKEAIVLDVRYNGGGFTHDQVLNYLGAKDHTLFRQRNGGEGPVLRSYDRKWTRPLVLLINNRSYSDAEIFPSAFRTLGLGKLVGEPTGGHVIGTSSVRLIDGSNFRIPRTGVFTIQGIDMEKQGVVPDVVVTPHPDQLALGHDMQLDRAVDVLHQTVADWKKARAPLVLKPEPQKPATSVRSHTLPTGPTAK